MRTQINYHSLARIICLGTIVGMIVGGSVGCKFGNSSREAFDNSDHSDSHDDNSIDNGGSGGDNLGGNFEPVCGNRVNGIDGPGGFLWKTTSDLDGNLAILFPSAFTTPFISVCLNTRDSINECGVFHGFDTQQNDDDAIDDEATSSEFDSGDDTFVRRQVWRFSMPGSEYIGVVKVDHTNELCVWVVNDTTVDQD